MRAKATDFPRAAMSGEDAQRARFVEVVHPEPHLLLP
jgi:hypothetical protein